MSSQPAATEAIDVSIEHLQEGDQADADHRSIPTNPRDGV
jgi:hypothetical protein